MFTSYEQERFENEIQKMDSLKPGEPLKVDFYFNTEKQMVHYLETAAEKNVTSLDFSRSYMASQRVGWLAKHIDLIPDLKELNLSLCDAKKMSLTKLLRKLPETQITRLNIGKNGIYKDQACSDALIDLLKSRPIEYLNIEGNTYADDFEDKFLSVLPTSSLKEVVAHSGMRVNSKEFGKAIACSNLTHLDLSENYGIKKEALYSIAEYLPDMKLTSLNIGNASLGGPEAKTICDAVRQSNLKNFTVSFGSCERHEEENILASALDLYLSSESKLENSHISLVLWSDESKKKLSEAHKIMMQRAAYRKAYEKKAEAKKGVVSVPENLSLSEALEQGVIAQLLAQRSKPLTAVECLHKDTEDVSFISKAGKLSLLPELMSAERWNNAKEMQRVWDAVDPSYRWQLDGQRGRLSYQTEKNKVMKKSVASLLAAKGKDRRT